MISVRWRSLLFHDSLLSKRFNSDVRFLIQSARRRSRSMKSSSAKNKTMRHHSRDTRIRNCAEWEEISQMLTFTPILVAWFTTILVFPRTAHYNSLWLTWRIRISCLRLLSISHCHNDRLWKHFQNNRESTEYTDNCREYIQRITTCCDCVRALERFTSTEVLVVLNTIIPSVDHEGVDSNAHRGIWWILLTAIQC